MQRSLNEGKRVSLYKNVAALVRAYSNIANEMEAAGYSIQEAKAIKGELEHFSHMRLAIKVASKDEVDIKLYEPAMRRLLDSYIRAEGSAIVSDFEEMGLIELIVEKAKQNPAEASSKKVPEAMAETIENNIRKTIIDKQPINPKYYEKMSELLDALIAQRREEAISYQDYLQQVKNLAGKITTPQGTTQYPAAVNTRGKQSLYDNLDHNEELVMRIDSAIRYTKKADWKANKFRLRSVENAVTEELGSYKTNTDRLMDLIKNQPEYD